MVIVLYIASIVWHFHVPWYMWAIAAVDGVAYTSYVRIKN